MLPLSLSTSSMSLSSKSTAKSFENVFSVKGAWLLNVELVKPFGQAFCAVAGRTPSGATNARANPAMNPRNERVYVWHHDATLPSVPLQKRGASWKETDNEDCMETCRG